MAHADSSSGSQPLLPSPNAPGGVDSHGSPPRPLSSDLRFALLTTAIIVLSYVICVECPPAWTGLAYVGSTGSTSISFILPGLFYYKISDPDSIHHQRLVKEDDDATSGTAEESVPGPSGSAISRAPLPTPLLAPHHQGAGAGGENGGGIWNTSKRGY